MKISGKNVHYSMYLFRSGRQRAEKEILNSSYESYVKKNYWL